MIHTAPEALSWRKSRYSNGGDNCLEWARHADGSVAVRDSKNPAGPAIRLDIHAWREFLDRASLAGQVTSGALQTSDEKLAVVGSPTSEPAVWHLHHLASDVSLHFTADERDAFLMEICTHDAARTLVV